MPCIKICYQKREKKRFFFISHIHSVYKTSDRVWANVNAGAGLWKIVYTIGVYCCYSRTTQPPHTYTHATHLSYWLPKISSINAEVLLTWAFKLNDLECKRPKHEHTQTHINRRSRHPFDWISCDFRIVTCKSIYSLSLSPFRASV